MDSIVDSHFHIWDLALRRSYPYTDASFDWPGPQPATAAIHRDFTAAEVAAELGGSKVNNDNNCYKYNSDDNNQVEAAIFVQCLNRCPEEVAWVSKLAEEHPVIKGIVGGLDLTQVRQQVTAAVSLLPVPGPRGAAGPGAGHAPAGGGAAHPGRGGGGLAPAGGGGQGAAGARAGGQGVRLPGAATHPQACRHHR